MLISVSTNSSYYALELPFAPHVGDSISLPDGCGELKVIERTIVLKRIDYDKRIPSGNLHLTCVKIKSRY